MNKLKRQSLILFTLAHLLLFVYPMVSKTFHVHEEEAVHCCSSCAHDNSPAYETSEEHCPICEYELVNFVAEAQLAVTVYPHVYYVHSSEPAESFFLQSEFHFSRRGPPVI